MKNVRNATLPGTASALLSALGFGLMPIFANIAYKTGASVETVLSGRFLIAALLLWGIVLWKRLPVWVGWKLVTQSLVLGIMGYAAVSYCYFSALQYISASLTALLLYLYPVFVMIISLLLKLEQWETRKGLALISSLAGMGLLVGLSLDGLHPKGVILGAASGLVYALYILTSRQVGARIPVWTMTAYIVTGAFFTLTAIGLLKGTLQAAVSPTAWGAMAALAVMSSVLAISLLNFSIQWLGVIKASIISTSEPLFTILLDILVFGSVLSSVQWIGAAFILFSVLLLQLPMGKKAEIHMTASDA